MIRIAPTIRSDRQGDGHFGARRGSRTHNGIDYIVTPGDLIASPVDGMITKVGYPYASDLTYRYVEITDTQNLRHRLFYTTLHPNLQLNDLVIEGDQVAVAQDIAAKYPADEPRDAMINHVHYEIKRPDGTYMNPEEYHS